MNFIVRSLFIPCLQHRQFHRTRIRIRITIPTHPHVLLPEPITDWKGDLHCYKANANKRATADGSRSECSHHFQGDSMTTSPAPSPLKSDRTKLGGWAARQRSWGSLMRNHCQKKDSPFSGQPAEWGRAGDGQDSERGGIGPFRTSGPGINIMVRFSHVFPFIL